MEPDASGHFNPLLGAVPKPECLHWPISFLNRKLTMAENTGSTKNQQIPGFQLLQKLGEGGNAVVYQAKQLSLDRMVAIKVLPKSATRDKAFVERFYAEGRAAGRLNHANIVGALDVGQAGDFHYFVMEYVEGKTVFDRIQDEGHLPEDESVSIMLDVARGLEHAHAAGLIHRDVKPQNIILTRQGTAKLSDLGLAREAGDDEAAQQEQGKTFGTPYYISPEQILSDPKIDHRADLYSCGATLYYMLTGQVPFDAPTAQGVLRKHLKEALIPPRKHNKFVTEGASQVIQVCMAKDRQQRYASTSQLVQDLEALRMNEPPLHAQTILGVELFEEEKPRAAAPARPAPAVKPAAEFTLAQVQQMRDTLSRAQQVFYLAIVGWGLALVFLTLWLLHTEAAAASHAVLCIWLQILLMSWLLVPWLASQILVSNSPG